MKLCTRFLPLPNSLHLPCSRSLSLTRPRLTFSRSSRPLPLWAHHTTSTIARASSRPQTSGHAFPPCLSRFPSTLRLHTSNYGSLSSLRCPHHTFSMPALAVSSYSCVSLKPATLGMLLSCFTPTILCYPQFGMFSLFIREKVCDHVGMVP